jgi:hypothetical protein
LPAAGPAQVILEALDEHNGVNDNGDDERVVREERPVVAAGIDPEEKANFVRNRMRTQLQSLLLTKDLACEKDREVCLRSISSLAKREDAHLIPGFDIGAEALMVYSECMRRSADQRLVTSTRLSQDAMPWYKVAYQAFVANKSDLTLLQAVTANPVAVSGTLIDRLKAAEATEPFSKPTFERGTVASWLAGKVARHLVLPTVEEIAKRVLTRLYYAFVPSTLNETGAAYLAWLCKVFLWACRGTFGKILLQSSFGRATLKFVWAMSGPVGVRGVASAARSAIGTMPKFPGIVVSKSGLPLEFGSFALAMYEARKTSVTSADFWLGTVMRTVAHSILERSFGFVGACFAHTIWNIGVETFGPKLFALRCTNSWNEDLTKVGAMEHAGVCLNDHKLKTHPVCPDFKVKHGRSDCDNKFGTACSFGVKGFTATVYRPCHHNEEISMNGRVGKLIPAQKSVDLLGAIRGKWRAVTRELIDHFDLRIKRVLKPIPMNSWLAGFPPSKREMFQGLIDDHAMVPRDPKASSFIKKEIVVKADDDLAFKDPRFVQGCPPELSLATGRYLRKFAKHLRDGMRPKRVKGFVGAERRYDPDSVRAGRQIVYTCGLSNQEIGDAYTRALNTLEAMCPHGDQVVILEDDQSRFDLHMGEGAFHFLNQLYCRKMPKHVARLLRRKKVIKGKSHLDTKYSIHAMMQSGWPDTSAGDTAVNAVMKTHIHGVGRPWISIVCGDDSVTVTLRSEIERLGGAEGIVKAYETFGMEVEAKVSDDPLMPEFCSSRFFWHGDGYYLIPKVGKMLSKLCWDMVDRGPKQRAAWMRSIVATMDMFGQVDPLLCALGNNFRQQLGEGPVVAEKFNEFKQVFRGEVAKPPELSVAVYYDAHYGFSYGNLVECVSHLSEVKLGTLSDHPLVKWLAWVDCQ